MQHNEVQHDGEAACDHQQPWTWICWQMMLLTQGLQAGIVQHEQVPSNPAS